MIGFANGEEDFRRQRGVEHGPAPRDKHVMAWRIGDEMRHIGAKYVQAGLWRGLAVRDGNLITGQQNSSGTESAEALIRPLEE